MTSRRASHLDALNQAITTCGRCPRLVEYRQCVAREKRRAFRDLGIDAMGQLLTGPCAIAYGGDNIVDLAKVMVEWSGKLEKLQIKGGYLDGQILDAAQARNLSQMPSRRQLQAQVVSLALAPGGRVAGAIAGPAGFIAGCIKALVEKLEKAEAA